MTFAWVVVSRPKHMPTILSCAAAGNDYRFSSISGIVWSDASRLEWCGAQAGHHHGAGSLSRSYWDGDVHNKETSFPRTMLRGAGVADGAAIARCDDSGIHRPGGHSRSAQAPAGIHLMFPRRHHGAVDAGRGRPDFALPPIVSYPGAAYCHQRPGQSRGRWSGGSLAPATWLSCTCPQRSSQEPNMRPTCDQMARAMGQDTPMPSWRRDRIRWRRWFVVHRDFGWTQHGAPIPLHAPRAAADGANPAQAVPAAIRARRFARRMHPN